MVQNDFCTIASQRFSQSLAVMVDLNNVFERRQKLSVYWHNKASDLRGSAGALWASMHEASAYATAEKLGLGQGFSFTVGCYPVYHMLCGMSLELLLKAVLVERGFEPKTTHDLVLLCADAGISLTTTQTGLLKILSEAIVWDGRYPVPKQEPRFRQFIVLRYEHLFDQLTSSSTLKLRKSNSNLNWESFNKLWSLISEAYEHHH